MSEDKKLLYRNMDIHLMTDPKPSEYLNSLRLAGKLDEHPFSMLIDMVQTKQSPKYHPEGSVWNHTMMVVDEAAKVRKQSKYIHEFMWAALLHDIGKPKTTKVRKGKITSYDHDIEGEDLARKFLLELTSKEDFIHRVCSLVRWHMNILYVINDLPFADIPKMKQSVNLEELTLLGYCDRMGRLGAKRSKEEQNTRIFLRKVRGA